MSSMHTEDVTQSGAYRPLAAGSSRCGEPGTGSRAPRWRQKCGGMIMSTVRVPNSGPRKHGLLKWPATILCLYSVVMSIHTERRQKLSTSMPAGALQPFGCVGGHKCAHTYALLGVIQSMLSPLAAAGAIAGRNAGNLFSLRGKMPCQYRPQCAFYTPIQADLALARLTAGSRYTPSCSSIVLQDKHTCAPTRVLQTLSHRRVSCLMRHEGLLAALYVNEQRALAQHWCVATHSLLRACQRTRDGRTLYMGWHSRMWRRCRCCTGRTHTRSNTLQQYLDTAISY